MATDQEIEMNRRVWGFFTGLVQSTQGIAIHVLCCVVIATGVVVSLPAHAEDSGAQRAESALKKLAASENSTEFCAVLESKFRPRADAILVHAGEPGDGEPLVRLTSENWKAACPVTLGEVFKRGELYAPPFCVERKQGIIRCSVMTATSIPRVVVFRQLPTGALELRSIDWHADEMGPGD